MSHNALPLEELDVRPLRKPDKHPTIFRTFDTLPVGGAFVLVNNHDPRHLRDEFELDHPGGYGWEYVERGPDVWRIRISKVAATALPRVLGDTREIAAGADAAGALWKLQMRERDLDANIIHVPADGAIDAHTGPDLDVLVHVLAGAGRLVTEVGALDLGSGSVVWLPKQSRRGFIAGPDGLTYLTVHRRRQSLPLNPTVPA